MRIDAKCLDGRGQRYYLVIVGAVSSLLALTACYDGPNLRDCSQYATTSIPGCYDGQGGGGGGIH
jgi:hypothetical protein